MAKKDEERLSWLAQELLDAEYDETREEETIEEEEVLLDPEDPDYMDDEIDEDSAVFVDMSQEKKKKKERAGMVLMALISMGLIGTMIGWWLKWRS